VTVKTENIPAGSRPATVSASASTSSAVAQQQLVEDDTEHLKAALLRKYCGQKKPARGYLDDEQIAKFLPLVHKIARRVAIYLKPPLSFEDLVSAGTVGLVKAARDFDPSFQTEFNTYAYIRVKGAILDELRSLSLLPANLNKQVRNARQLCQKIAIETGAVPSDDQIASKLGITVDEVYQLFENARAQHFVSIDDFTEARLPDGQGQSSLGQHLTARPGPPYVWRAGRDTTSPDKHIERAELIDKLTQAIQQLDQRRRQIILLYYQQHLTMKQIAQLLAITESRVSQLHASAIFNLSIKLRQWKDGG